MRKLLTVLLCTVFMLTLCCCSPKQEHKLLENAPVSENAMALYRFDGEQTEVKWIFNEQEEKIVSEINKLNARSVDSAGIPDLKMPCYGIEIGEIHLTYSNGYWLDKSGSVYKVKYDLEKAFKNAQSEDMQTDKGGLRMPNAWYLGTKDVRFYQKAADMKSEKDGLVISFVGIEGNTATVNLKNTANDPKQIGEYFKLQKKIDGVWYTIPSKDSMAFHDIAYNLESGQDLDFKHNLAPYGELAKGQYRIEMEGIVCEFEI